jgi:hypothetical protein
MNVEVLIGRSSSTHFQIVRRLLATVADDFVFDDLTFVEGAQAGAFDGGDMDEYILAAALGLDESVALRRVEPFDGASRHRGLLACTNLIAAARPSCDRIRSQRCPREGTPAGAQQNKAKLEY